jgi:hypothetical protein
MFCCTLFTVEHKERQNCAKKKKSWRKSRPQNYSPASVTVPIGTLA